MFSTIRLMLFFDGRYPRRAWPLRLLTAHTRLGHYPSRRGLPFLLEDRDSARRTCYCLLGTLVTVSRQGARSRGGREDLVCVNWSKALSSPSYLVTRRAELR